MGMFDYLIVRVPLPGDPPEFVRGDGHRFQTKDLDCELATYEIAADGRLARLARDDETTPETYSGAVDFYDTNCRAGAYGHRFTDGGEDYESVEYRATFDAGRLIGIAETGRECSPALPIRELDAFDRLRIPTEAEKAEGDRYEGESLLGRDVFVLVGGYDIVVPGAAESDDIVDNPLFAYAATVVAEGPHEWVARKDDGRFEILPRYQRGSTVFDSREDAARARSEERREHGERKAVLDAMLADRNIPT